MTNDELKMLRELEAKSTRVVAWYPYRNSDSREPNEPIPTVRGPFNRWFYVKGGDEYPQDVAEKYDDAEFAAAAMNNLLGLLDEIAKLKKRVSFLAELGLMRGANIPRCKYCRPGSTPLSEAEVCTWHGHFETALAETHQARAKE